MTHGRGGDGPIFVKDGVVHCHAEISPGAARISLWCVTVWLAGLIMAVIYIIIQVIVVIYTDNGFIMKVNI